MPANVGLTSQTFQQGNRAFWIQPLVVSRLTAVGSTTASGRLDGHDADALGQTDPTSVSMTLVTLPIRPPPVTTRSPFDRRDLGGGPSFSFVVGGSAEPEDDEDQDQRMVWTKKLAPAEGAAARRELR
jgi:hypothetical protein